VKKAIQKLLVTIDQRVQFMGECKDHMEVRRVYDLRPAFVHPDLLQDCLAVGTVSVPTGVIVDFCMPTVRTPTGIVPKASAFASHNGMCDLLQERKGI